MTSPRLTDTVLESQPDTAITTPAGYGDQPLRPSSSDTARLSGRAASLALFAVLFASFMDLLDVTIVTVAAPTLAADLEAPWVSFRAYVVTRVLVWD